jgi:putative lipoic acid-binding regulatory protein
MSEERKSLLKFPCAFPLKVIGKDADDFEGFVLAIFRKHADPATYEGVETRPSGMGTYLAVTVTFTASSQLQIDALYRELGASDRVLVVL